MTTHPVFAAAHRDFSVNCFNKAWELIEKPGRTDDENEQMIRLSQASLWHWTQRGDCRPRNLSIGYWQLSRVYALAGRGQEALRYGRLALDASQGDEPFYVAYAYEALARAAQVAGDEEQSRTCRENAVRLAEQISQADERKQLLGDLSTIG
jgi:hypothetical protein